MQRGAVHSAGVTDGGGVVVRSGGEGGGAGG